MADTFQPVATPQTVLLVLVIAGVSELVRPASAPVTRPATETLAPSADDATWPARPEVSESGESPPLRAPSESQ